MRPSVEHWTIVGEAAADLLSIAQAMSVGSQHPDTAAAIRWLEFVGISAARRLGPLGGFEDFPEYVSGVLQ